MTLPLEVEITLPDNTVYKQPTGLFVNNQFVESIDGATIDTFDPSTGEKLATVYCANEKDVDQVVIQARNAFENVWKKIPGTKKGEYLYKLGQLMVEHKEVLSSIECADSGKPKYTNAIFDVVHCAQVLKYYAGWADKSFGKQIPTTDEKLVYTIHEPFGVCGQIIPWNYPLAMAIWKIAPAIAAGNVVIMKTAENTPLSMLYLMKLVVEAGFPAGVINVVTGLGPVCGSALAAHMDVDKISFTGSTAVGQQIQKLASSNLKAVTMECGGKTPMLIFEDSDMKKAAKWAAFGIMYNMGQICVGTSRIYIHSSKKEEFLKEFIDHVKDSYKQGNPFGKDIKMGPQVSKTQQKRVMGYIQKGIEEGATVELGGKIPEGYPEASCYVEPTIFSNVTQDMTIVQEEIFGPVVCLSTFETEEEALKLANDTSYGLGACVFTESLTRAHQLAKNLQSGQVWVNCTNSSDFRVPFGGVKMSGFGRELGEYGLSMYTQAKAVHINLSANL